MSTRFALKTLHAATNSAAKESRMPAAKRRKSQPKSKMNDALKEKVDAIQKKLRGAEHDDALARHEVGIDVLEIERDSEKYGQHAVKRVAAALGCTASIIYAYSKVARVWNKEDFTALLKKKNRFGIPLTFSHFIELEKSKDATTRDALIQEVLSEGWSVRQLRTKVPKHRANELGDGPGVTKKFVTWSVNAASRMQEGERLVEQLATGGGDGLRADELDLAVDNFRRIAGGAQAIVEQLESLARRPPTGSATASR